MTERNLTVHRRSPTSVASIWAVLADFPDLAKVWDGLKASEAIGDKTTGVVPAVGSIFRRWAQWSRPSRRGKSGTQLPQ